MNRYEYEGLTLEGVNNIARDLSKIISVDDTICLYGDLGAGKTQFAKFIISELMVDKEVSISSPTYNIVHTYDMKRKGQEIGHFDLYRLNSETELIELGFEEALENMLCIIEWPSIARSYLPVDRMDIYIDHTDDENLRNVVIESEKWLKL